MMEWLVSQAFYGMLIIMFTCLTALGVVGTVYVLKDFRKNGF